jgi:3'-phosphoadenosine 5'-phosphosulfate sulfotransferase (PAPS reductase)/FAD synthetase
MSTSVNTQPSPDDLAALNQSLEGQAPTKILEIALEQYESCIILACSFGAEDVVLLDMMLRINPRSVLFYLDTDFLFPETYAVRDRIIKHYQLQDEQIIQMVFSKIMPHGSLGFAVINLPLVLIPALWSGMPSLAW